MAKSGFVPFVRTLTDDDVRSMRETRSIEGLGWTALGRRFGVDRRYAYHVCVGDVRREAGGPLEPPYVAPPKCAEHRCPGCGGLTEEPSCRLCDTRAQSIAINMLVDAGLVSRETLIGKVRERRPWEPTEEEIWQRAAEVRARRTA